MDTDAQWPEGIGVVKVPQVMEVNNSGGAAAIIDHQRNNNNNNNNNKGITTKKPPPALNCPRCNSGNTKFCYYNNYSLTQPRYFCKTCRRYWTEGGSLRNVPVGGGSRKNKRSSASSSSSSLSSKIKLNLPEVNSQNPTKIMFHDQGRHDLNLAYPQSGPSATYNYMSGNNISEFVEFPSTTTTNTSSSSHHISQLLTSGIGGGRGGGFSSFMSMIPVSDSNGLPNFQEFSKPISGLNFSLDHNYGSLQGVVHHQESSNTNMNTNTNTTTTTSHAKLFFPFEDLKVQPVISTTSTQELMEESKDSQGDHHHQQQQATEYWNQGLGGGGSW